jgi:hypothetical protein
VPANVLENHKQGYGYVVITYASKYLKYLERLVKHVYMLLTHDNGAELQTNVHASSVKKTQVAYMMQASTGFFGI